MNWTEQEYRDKLNVSKVRLPRARGRMPQPTREMNKTETEYSNYLELKRLAGEIAYWGFDMTKIRIGHKCWYSPDFTVMYKDGTLEYHDTKAPGNKEKTIYRAQDDAIVKARASGARYPVPNFFVWKVAAGEWTKREM